MEKTSEEKGCKKVSFEMGGGNITILYFIFYTSTTTTITTAPKTGTTTIQKNETKQTSECEHSDAGKYIGLSDLFCEVDIYLCDPSVIQESVKYLSFFFS